MKLKAREFLPLLICAAVIAFAGMCQLATSTVPNFDIFRRLEWMTYDWRVRQASRAQNAVVATNLGFVAITDTAIKALLDGSLDYRAGLYWPRHVYGRLANELAVQGARAVAFDILFADLRPDHPEVVFADGTREGSDDFFARQLQTANNVVLGAEKGALPADLFRTNASAIGDISASRDADGILRRAKAFDYFYVWHPLIRQAGRLFDLSAAKVVGTNLVLPTVDGGAKVIDLDASGNFDQQTFYEEITGQKLNPPLNFRPMQKAFTDQRVWDLGITLAARELDLDLDAAEIDLSRGRIVLRGRAGAERIIPVDHEGRFYIDWAMRFRHPALTTEHAESLLLQEQARRHGRTNELANRWKDKLVVIGSAASGNDLIDLGATPLEKQTLLTSRFWNVANSVLLGRFIRQVPQSYEFLLVVVMALAAALVAWNLRALWSAVVIVSLAIAYLAIARAAYIESRLWLPLVFPLLGLFLAHFALVTYRAVFEQNEQRRIRKIFAKIVSPDVVNELLSTEKLALGGARRELTVFFADVRGFTEMTDLSHAKAEEYVRQSNLPDEAATAYLDEQAQEVLRTVNEYLGTVADVIKQHKGTLDKYIGDCVMAFWGAPTRQDKHAVVAVRAAIDAQRAVFALNRKRGAENKRRLQESAQRAARGEPPLAMLSLPTLGTGINTGMATVGLMGSDAHIVNYTVFGREVNVAARLEGVSGRGRIIIGEGTYRQLQRDDPALASTCIEMSPVTVKGIRQPVKIFEVPWKQATAHVPKAPESTTVSST